MAGAFQSSRRAKLLLQITEAGVDQWREQGETGGGADGHAGGVDQFAPQLLQGVAQFELAAGAGLQALTEVTHLHLQRQRTALLLGTAHGQAAQLSEVFQLAAGQGQALQAGLAAQQAQFQVLDAIEQLLNQLAVPGKVSGVLAQAAPGAIQLGQAAVVLWATAPQVIQFGGDLFALLTRLLTVLATQAAVFLQPLQQGQGIVHAGLPGLVVALALLPAQAAAQSAEGQQGAGGAQGYA